MKNNLIALIAVLFLPIFGYSQYSEYDWEERDTWMDTESIYKAIGIDKGSFVADIGCHEGYLSIRLANKVGDNGRVFAVDVRNDRLNTLRDNLKERELNNVDVILGDYDNPKLPENKLDAVIIMDTYHEMTDYMEILEHVYKSLKPGGKITIVEKLKSRIKGKSRDRQTDAHSLSPKYVKQELEKSGFEIIHTNNDMGNWENDPDKVMWMLVAIKEK